MDKMSVNEALVALLVEQDGVDATNAIQLLRNAQKNVTEAFEVVESAHAKGLRATHPNALKERWLNRLRDNEQVDSIIIVSSRNGGIDLFRE